MNRLKYFHLFTGRNFLRFFKLMDRQVNRKGGRTTQGFDEKADALKFGGVRMWTLCDYSGQRGIAGRVGVERN